MIPLSENRLMQWIDIMRQLRPSLTPDQLTNLSSWRYTLMTVLRDNKVVGAGAYYPTASLVKGKFNYLADLVTDAAYRGKGVGREMIEEVLATNYSCELDSGLEKIEAHLFYEKLSFKHTGYSVRPQVSVVEELKDLLVQPTLHIDSVKDLESLSIEKQKAIQAFTDANLNAFMQSNPDHSLLVLEDDSKSIQGILVYELQNRLSFGGKCFQVTDLIVKDNIVENQNVLLLALLQRAKDFNGAIKTVVIVMTEEEINMHRISKGNKAGGTSENKINRYFSATSKHFVK